ncbi:MAG: TetR/AcrR family transcriptional regulator [Calditrichaeota bacterium]|nr:MAG: TetR/AcrR family transcriptional regulator [Calditrichota bacterium]
MPNPHIDNTDARILKAAGRVLAQNGFQNASMRAIAQKAGVSISTLYHRFSSKQHLINSILESVWQDMADGAMAIAEDNNLDPLEKVDAVVDLFIRVFKKRPQRALVFIRAHQPALHDENDSLKAHYVHFLKSLAAIIQKGIIQNYINSQITPEAFALYMYGGMRALLHEWALNPKAIHLHTLSDSIKYQIKHGILHW